MTRTARETTSSRDRSARGPAFRASARSGRCPTSTSAVVAVAEPMFTSQERLVLAGFLAGYTGLTREACALVLRQYATWCH